MDVRRRGQIACRFANNATSRTLSTKIEERSATTASKCCHRKIISVQWISLILTVATYVIQYKSLRLTQTSKKTKSACNASSVSSLRSKKNKSAVNAVSYSHPSFGTKEGQFVKAAFKKRSVALKSKQSMKNSKPLLQIQILKSRPSKITSNHQVSIQTFAPSAWKFSCIGIMDTIPTVQCAKSV